MLARRHLDATGIAAKPHVVDDGQGIVPRTPQKVAVNAMANRCWLKRPNEDYHLSHNTIVTPITTFDNQPNQCCP